MGAQNLQTLQVQGVQHTSLVQKLIFPGQPMAKISRQGPPGFARAQPWTLNYFFGGQTPKNSFGTFYPLQKLGVTMVGVNLMFCLV